MFQRTNTITKISILVPLIIITILLSQVAPLGYVPVAAQESQNLCPQDVAKEVKAKFNKTGKDAFISLGIPDAMTAALDKVVQALTGKDSDKASQFFDFKNANYAFGSDSGQIKAIVVPLDKSGTTDPKKSDAKTPDDNKDMKFVGGVYVPGISDSVMVLVSLTENFEIRLYDTSRKQVAAPSGQSVKFSVRQYTEKPSDDKTPIPTAGDLGAKIAEQEMCFTYGTMQACIQYELAPDANDPDKINKADKVNNAEKVLDPVYHYKASGVTFDTVRIVADLVGDDERKLCAATLTAYPFSGKSINECKPTAIYTAPENIEKLPTLPNFPGCGLIGLIDLTNRQPENQKSFKLDSVGNPNGGEVYEVSSGKNLGALPLGQYLMFTMQPDAKPGDKVAILLADSSKNLYIIPGIRVEGFGVPQSGTPDANSKFSAYIYDPGSGGYGMP